MTPLPPYDETETFESVWDDLEQQPLVFYDRLRAIICKTVLRLPAEIRSFAKGNCSFVPFENSLYGQTWRASVFTRLAWQGETVSRTTDKHWVILLNASLEKNEKNAQFTVAHEIAHAWLGHHVLSDHPLMEEEADALAESWGFETPRRRRQAKKGDASRIVVDELTADTAGLRVRQMPDEFVPRFGRVGKKDLPARFGDKAGKKTRVKKSSKKGPAAK